MSNAQFDSELFSVPEGFIIIPSTVLNSDGWLVSINLTGQCRKTYYIPGITLPIP